MPGSKRYSVSKQEEIWNRQQIRNHSVFAQQQQHKNSGDNQRSFAQGVFIYLPVLDACILMSTIISCYLLTKKTVDTEDILFPNEVALDDPQSRIFATGMSLSSLITLVLFTLKYKQVDSLFSGFINHLSFTCGSLASLAQFLLGNFPMKDSMTWVNIIAIICYLSFTILYCALHIYLTRNTPAISSKAIYILRILILELILLSGAVLCAFLVPTLSHWNRAPNNVAQIASWCCISFILAYKLTFVNDLKQMYFHLNILISPSQAEAIYKVEPQRRLLIEEDSASTRISTRSKKSRSSVRSTGTMSEINTIYNYPVVEKSSV